MSEKIRIGEYKGFELWHTTAPEGWRVHQYPVQVTSNGEHVNNFADANEAMSVIDGMDADTVAYHMRRATPDITWDELSLKEQVVLMQSQWGAIYLPGDPQRSVADDLCNKRLMIGNVINEYQLSAAGRAMLQPAPAAPTGDGAVDVLPSKIEQAAADLKTSVDIIAAKGIGSEVIQMNVDYLTQQLEIGKMPIATAIVLGDLLLMFEAILEMQATATE